ncbi:MAG: UvrB/UvrC motif-containing protein [Verrucomicrobiota bacterium]|nr:UvrB/UvrC motif-containing protein [Verrucomicrobiota bacterium]
MICKQNDAKVYLTQIVADKIQKVDLCEECAKNKGANDPAGFNLADLLLGLGASQELATPEGSEDIKCPTCGFTQADFKKAGRLGCAECYNTFAEGLESLLKSMHKGTKHAGKVPLGFRRSHDLSDQLKALQKKLDKAVATEDFEVAAGLRDEIKETRQKINHLPAV